MKDRDGRKLGVGEEGGRRKNKKDERNDDS
jgi:hypothetical protein